MSFDDSTCICVVDNCVNIHIWNELEHFIPSTYVKLDNDKTPKVSAVKGISNQSSGCGDIPISWKDENGGGYSIVFKMSFIFLTFP